jgi:hypothetical protein
MPGFRIMVMSFAAQELSRRDCGGASGRRLHRPVDKHAHEDQLNILPCVFDGRVKTLRGRSVSPRSDCVVAVTLFHGSNMLSLGRKAMMCASRPMLETRSLTASVHRTPARDPFDAFVGLMGMIAASGQA